MEALAAIVGMGVVPMLPWGPCSYQDFVKTHPPTFTPTAEPLDAEHWLRILEQKF